jgi:LuxR family maltose regulon positive regulatory protein
MLLVLGRPADVEPAVRAAETGVAPGPMRDGSRSIESSAAMVRTSARLLLGDVARASETAALAAELEPDPRARWRPIVTNALGMTAYWSGRSEDALEAFHETVSAAAAVGNHTAAIYALGYLAAIAAERGDYARASKWVDQALSLAAQQELSEHWVTVMVHYAAGACARARGDRDEARTAIERGLDLARRGGLRLDTGYGLLALAEVALLAGERQEANELHARAARQISSCADPGILAQRLGRTSRTTPPREGLPTDGSADDLSPRELAVLRLMSSELTLREIGDQLYVSFNTVKTHARNVYAKLRVSSRADAVARARELKLL